MYKTLVYTLVNGNIWVEFLAFP